MPFKMQPGRNLGSAGDVPAGADIVPDAAATLKKGQIARMDAQGELEAHPGVAVVTGIFGVMLENVVAGDPASPAKTASVAKADRNTEFVAKVHDGGVFGADVGPVVVGTSYGYLNNANGFSFVDQDDVTNVVLQVTQKDADLDIVWFRFLESAIQL